MGAMYLFIAPPPLAPLFSSPLQTLYSIFLYIQLQSGRCAPVVNLLTATTPVVAVNVISHADTTLERSCFQRPHDDDVTPTNGYLSPAAVNSPPLSAVTDVVDRQRKFEPKKL